MRSDVAIHKRDVGQVLTEYRETLTKACDMSSKQVKEI